MRLCGFDPFTVASCSGCFFGCGPLCSSSGWEVRHRLEEAVVECPLPGDVTLKLRRAVKRTAGREKQVLVLAEIDHSADVESRAKAGKINFRQGLMINFNPYEHVGQDLILQHDPAKSPILMA